MTSKSHNFFKFELDVHNNVPEFYTPVQIFISIRSAGGFSPDKWNITVLRLFPRWLYSIFLGHALRSNLWMDFRGLWLIRRVFAQGRFFWGLRQYQNSFGGNIPKTPRKGRERRSHPSAHAQPIFLSLSNTIYSNFCFHPPYPKLRDWIGVPSSWFSLPSPYPHLKCFQSLYPQCLCFTSSIISYSI